jgi:ABC-type branched-subunit amino acid transport system substrate-binding protein
LAIAGVMVLVATGCGARLTQAQISALNSTGSGSSVTPGATATGSTSSGATSGATPTCVTVPATKTTKAKTTKAKTAKAKATTPTTICSTTGASGPTSAAGSSAGHYVAGSAGRTVGGSAGGTSGGHGSTGGASSGGGTGVAIPASSPLAGPGGKICPPGAPGSGPGVTASQIQVGNITTINGPVPGLFAGARYGTQAFAAYVNSLGGLCGRQIVVNSADDQFDQANDQNEASQMASNSLALVGSFSLQDAGIPAGAPGVPDVGNTLSAARFNSATNFSPQPQPPGFQTSAFLYFKSNPKYAAATQHMAMLIEDTAQTLQTGQWEQSALESVGYHFVFTDSTLQPTDPTFNGDVQKMKSAGVQGIVFQATGTIVGQLANSMYQAGMIGPGCSPCLNLPNYVASAYDPAFIQNAGPAANGTILSQSLALYDGQDAAAVPMVATFDQWYGRVNPGQVPDLYAAYGWLSGMLFAEGINAGGAPTRAALLAGLRQITSFTGDGLVATGNPAGKQPPLCFLLIDVKNNQFVRDPATASGFTCSPGAYHRA